MEQHTQNESMGLVRPPVTLDVQDGGKRIIVPPDDHERFAIISERAAEACKQALNLRAWRQEFHSILFDVREWAEVSVKPLQACYIAIGEGHLVIFAMSTQPTYDWDLADALTDLDIHIANKYPLCHCEVMQLPSEAMGALEMYFNPAEAVQIYGNGN